MSLDQDIPNLYFEKPKKVTELLELSLEQREAMDLVEIEERVRDTADSLAEGYKNNNKNGDYEGCVEVVSTALKEIGGSLGGKMGARTVGIGDNCAHNACRLHFPKAE